MKEHDRYVLAVQLEHEAQAEISNAILSMSCGDVAAVIRHLAAAKAYLNAVKSWVEGSMHNELVTRRLDEVIEAVSERQWKEAWRLCWELLRPQELIAAYRPAEEPPLDEQGSGDQDEGDIA